MTVSSTASKVTYEGNGVATSFSFSFLILQTADLEVVHIDSDGVETVLTETTDYTVSLSSPGGTVTYPVSGAALPATEYLTLRRAMTIEQATDLVNGGPYYAQTVEDMVDRPVMLIQQQQEQIDRGLQVPVNETGPLPIPRQSERSSKVLGFGADGVPTMYEPASAVTEASNVNFLQAGARAVSRTMQDKAREVVSVKDFKNADGTQVAGDGTQDDTTGIQAALGTGKFVVFPKNPSAAVGYKTTAALTYTGPGIWMEPGAALTPTGSGYTALSITPIAFGGPWRIIMTGDNAAKPDNGVLWTGGAGTGGYTIEQIRVSNCTHFGLKMDRVQDAFIDSLSVQNCGSATEYAFSWIDEGTDTNNVSHVARLQVENCAQKVIYIDPRTLSCTFDNIHSEGATGNGTDATWLFGGQSCQYNTMRLDGDSSSFVRFNLVGTVVEPRIESAIAYVEVYGTTGGEMTIIGGGMDTWLRQNASSLTRLTLIGCDVSRVESVGVIHMKGGRVASLGPAETSNWGYQSYEGVYVTSKLYSGASGWKATLRDCYIQANEIGFDYDGVANGDPAFLDAQGTRVIGGTNAYKINAWDDISANLKNSWATSADPGPRARQDGYTVTVEGRVNGGTTINETPFLNVPARYRPSDRRVGIITAFDSTGGTYAVGSVLLIPTAFGGIAAGDLILTGIAGHNTDANFEISWQLEP